MLPRHLSHLDYISTRVRPVKVASDPVHCDTTGHLQLLDLDTGAAASRAHVVLCEFFFFFLLGTMDTFDRRYLQVGDPALAWGGG